MAIKPKNYCIFSLLIIILVSLMLVRLPITTSRITKREEPHTNAITIVDKVYTFLAPNDALFFEDMVLKEDYMYYIYVKVVTPHNCELNITLWDPQSRRYDIFSSNLKFAIQGYESAEIPFGTALEGNYTFSFSMELISNLNLHIRIEEGDLCLRDKISTGDWNKMIFYRVTKFDDGAYIEHNIQLKSDTSYRIYFGRVSPIAAFENNNVYLLNNITDPQDVEFNIYTNHTLAPIDDIQDYHFGTSIEGLYVIELQVRSDVEYVNLAYSIIEDYVISDLNDNNQTGTPDNSTSHEHGLYSIPVEILTIFSLIIISIISLLGVFIYHRHQKRSVAINLSQY
jgi:hypothetical protein